MGDVIYMDKYLAAHGLHLNRRVKPAKGDGSRRSRKPAKKAPARDLMNQVRYHARKTY